MAEWNMQWQPSIKVGPQRPQIHRPSNLTAQLKAEKLMVFPSTADSFRATVSILRFLDGRKGVSFHTPSLPDDRCMRLLVNNLGKRMPGSIVREELESLNIQVQGSCSSDRAAATRIPPRSVLPPLTSSYQWHGALTCPRSDLSPNSTVCE
jgi:hypothetical protein